MSEIIAAVYADDGDSNARRPSEEAAVKRQISRERKHNSPPLPKLCGGENVCSQIREILGKCRPPCD